MLSVLRIMEPLTLILVISLIGLLSIMSLFAFAGAFRHIFLGSAIIFVVLGVLFLALLPNSEARERILNLRPGQFIGPCPLGLFRTTDYVAFEGTGDSVFYLGTKKLFICSSVKLNSH